MTKAREILPLLIIDRRFRDSVTRLDLFCALGNFSKPLETINLPKSPTFLVNFCKGVKIIIFSSEIIIDIWRFLLVTLVRDNKSCYRDKTRREWPKYFRPPVVPVTNQIKVGSMILSHANLVFRPNKCSFKYEPIPASFSFIFVLFSLQFQ